jgi:hypothetical protein
MKLTAIISIAIAAVGLAACGSTEATQPTATPTLAPVVAPASTPTLAPTQTPAPAGVYVTETCSNVPVMWAQKAYPKGSILGKATWHNLTLGDYFGIGLLTTLVTSHTMSVGVEGFGNAINAFQQGTWEWSELTGVDQTVTVARGSLTIPACPGKSI